MGAMMGMAIGDTVGAPLEFLPVDSPNHRFNPESLSHTGALNKFRLQAGQWSDDTSMGLCLADSLLVCARYDGSDIRVRFWNWWNRGYNNAFRLDDTRSGSVGLGGNIGKSLSAIENSTPPPRFANASEDSGNGSLMRLAPIPIYFHKDIDVAVAASAESSRTTHPGSSAADACAFLGFVIVCAMKQPVGCEKSAATFLDECCEAYLQRPAAGQQLALKRLLLAKEPVGSTERCWNWRDPNGPFLSETLRARGNSYNGYPVDPGYFGSYCMDGLAVALHCVYHTVSFMDAITRCVNFLGDADSSAAICGQIAGAIYGVRAIDERLIGAVEVWDSGEIALRGALLHAAGMKLSGEAFVLVEQSTRVVQKSAARDRSRSRCKGNL
jgi:ADP-ribosyl-[dinitrogen reductase] hydrolase